MKSLEIKVNSFNGGISDDIRQSSASVFSITKHFDIFSNPQRLTPYRSLEADTETSVSATDLKQYAVKDFVYASASTKLYGLGQTGGGLTNIFYKSVAESGLWVNPATPGNGAVKNGCFFEHANYLWGFQGTNQIWKWGTLSGSPSITNSAAIVGATITSVANGIITPGTGEAYLAYNNVIVRISQDGATVTDNAKTVATNLKITSLANYGSYLAIGCSPKDSYNGVSKVFLWNLSSDLFAETIDWGEGDLRVLEPVEGLLVGVTDRYLNNATGAGRGSMIIQGYSGGSAQVLKEIFTQALVNKTMPTSKVVKNNRLFWAAKIMTNSAGTEYVEGLWSFGRKNVNYPYALTLDVIDENINTSGIQGFGSAANYFFIAHSGDGSVDKTNDAATYAFTSTYESQIYSFEDPSTVKTLKEIVIHTVALPASSSIGVDYRVDGATSWTLIGTLSTTGALSRHFLNIESSSANFSSFREVQFRFRSLGGAELTGYEVIASTTLGK